MFRFTIREVLWLTVIGALALGWWIDYRAIHERNEALIVQSKRLRETLLEARDVHQSLRASLYDTLKHINVRGTYSFSDPPAPDWNVISEAEVGQQDRLWHGNFTPADRAIGIIACGALVLFGAGSFVTGVALGRRGRTPGRI